MESVPLLDCVGRRRSPATLSSFRQDRPRRNKGLRYPVDPPTVEEIIAVMRPAGDTPEGIRLRAVIEVLWRSGLRISEALALTESKPDLQRGAILVPAGKAVAGARSGWTAGAGTTVSVARAASRPARRTAVCMPRGPTRGRPCARRVSAGSCAALPRSSASRRPACSLRGRCLRG